MTAQRVQAAEEAVYAVGDLEILLRGRRVHALAGDLFDLLHQLADGVCVVLKRDGLFPVGGDADLAHLDALELHELADAADVAVGLSDGDEVGVGGDGVEAQLHVARHGTRQGVHEAQHVVEHGVRRLGLAAAAHEIGVGARGTDELLGDEGAVVLDERRALTLGLNQLAHARLRAAVHFPDGVLC